MTCPSAANPRPKVRVSKERHDKRKSILFLKHARSVAYNVMDEPRMNYIYDDIHRWASEVSSRSQLAPTDYLRKN